MIKWPWHIHNAKVDSTDLWMKASSIPLLSPLTPLEKSRLIALAEQFIASKRIVPLQGVLIDDIMHARIALLFSLPILEFDIQWLDTFHEVLLYPAPFIVNDEWQDDMGLVHTGKMVQSGQSWEQGPIVLNWLDIQDSFDLSGFNLIIHETAHKLDMRNGGHATGVPPIPLREVACWEKAIRDAMDNIQNESDLVGEDNTSVDAYAATEPSECFAVLSEYFFSAPDLLAARFPDIYRHFKSFYRQDPLQRLLNWERHRESMSK